MIVERVNRIPVVQMAISAGFNQYAKLKSSSATVGDVITQAEFWALYVWKQVQPIMEKFQDPINKADQMAVSSIDFVEGKLERILAWK